MWPPPLHLLGLYGAVEKVNSGAIKPLVTEAAANTASVTFLFC
jgi:hypothetical protein